MFGTDGWRDVIGDRFTMANLGRAAQAYAGHLLDGGGGLVLVGYDTRFNGPLFARHVAAVLAANGLQVRLTEAVVPTPALSFAVRAYGAAGGVMLTASHNPAAYHGFKLKGAYGGTATDAIYRDVARRVGEISAADVAPVSATTTIARFDVREDYYQGLERVVDVDTLATLHGRIVHDAMGGAAAGWLRGFVESRGLRLEVEEIRGRPDPMFYGVNPEPIGPNLALTQRRMHSDDAHFAVATDGDGDRLGIVLPGGAFFNSHQIFALLVDHLAAAGVPGSVVKTFTVSRIVERLARARGREVVETPVGFKHIVDAMLAGDVMVGGEESGGIGVAGHLPERDGVANALLLLESVARSGLGLAERFAQLERETGWQHAYDRLDLHLKGNELKERVMRDVRSAPPTTLGRRIRSVEDRDGVKLNLADDAWLLFRPSGTEPVLRIYCEAPTAEDVRRTLAAAKAWVDARA